jgi:hypothetical protein
MADGQQHKQQQKFYKTFWVHLQTLFYKRIHFKSVANFSNPLEYSSSQKVILTLNYALDLAHGAWTIKLFRVAIREEVLFKAERLSLSSTSTLV